MTKGKISEAPVALGELFGKDLTGWQVCASYLLEIDHTLMGFFPAIYHVGNKADIVLVLHKRLLRAVWNKIERARAKISVAFVLANPELGIAFDLRRNGDPAQTRTLKIFSEADIVELCKKSEPFCWSPGIMGARGNFSPPKFDD